MVGLLKRRTRNLDKTGNCWVVALLFALTSAPGRAEINSFQATETAFWGGWNRSDTGTVFAQWDAMSPLVNGISNYTPDGGQHGVLIPNTSAGAELRVVPFTAGLTVTQNYYSPFNVPDFDITVLTDVPHQSLPGEVSIALQVAILGAEIVDAEVRLNCAVTHADDDNNPATNSFNDDLDSTQTDTPLSETECIPYDQKIVLETGSSTGPQGESGIDNEYLYIWRLPSALAGYTFDVTSSGTSMSLDALSVDIGPAPFLEEENVPLPIGSLVVLGTIFVWLQARVRKVKPLDFSATGTLDTRLK